MTCRLPLEQFAQAVARTWQNEWKAGNVSVGHIPWRQLPKIADSLDGPKSQSVSVNTGVEIKLRSSTGKLQEGRPTALIFRE